MKQFSVSFIFFFMFTDESTLSLAQPCEQPLAKASIVVMNPEDIRDTIWFGHDSQATCGVDPQFCEISMAELCGPPAPIFCVGWGGWCPPRDVMPRLDYRQFYSSTQVDTFRLLFQEGSAGFPIRFKWNPASIRRLCDSAVINYPFNAPAVRYRMDLIDSLEISSFLGPSLRMIRYGARNEETEVSRQTSPDFSSFMLFDNYPNPFNPSTRISFSIPASPAGGPHSSFVTLKVYDLLGKEVATLVNEQLGPGDHERIFNAEGLTSGVYFYRLQAGGFVQTRKLLLLR